MSILVPLAVPMASVLAFAMTAVFVDGWRPMRDVSGALSDGEKREIASSVATLNQVYQDFFASGGRPDQINACPATASVKHFIFRDLGFLRNNGLALVQDLAEAHVVDVRRSGADVELVQYETWNYVYQRLSDRQPVSQLSGLGQGFRYTLRRQDGRWTVVAWDLDEVPEPDGIGEVAW
ncbi:MAG: hypothetical protein WCC48_05595 [Anaeromyxobacteraceae bacterium]